MMDAVAPQALEAESGLALGDESFALSDPGYIDPARPVTRVRIRGDFAYGNNRPDRAEFFYPKCGCFRPIDPSAPGPPIAETNVDYQEVWYYFEYAFAPRASAGIFQATYTAGVKLPSPLTSAQYYHRSLNSKKLVEIGFSHIGARMTLSRTIALDSFERRSSIVGWFRRNVPMNSGRK